MISDMFKNVNMAISVSALVIIAVCYLFVGSTALDIAKAWNGDELGDQTDILKAAHIKVAYDQETERYQYATLATAREFHPGRTVAFSTWIKANRLVSEDWDAAETSIRLSVKAREYAQEECALLKRTFASDCRVKKASAELSRDGGVVIVKATLNFVQKEVFQRIEQGVPARLETVSERVDFKDKSTDLSGFRSQRLKVYQEVTKACSKLRRHYGTCGIHAIALQPGRARGRDYRSGYVWRYWLASLNQMGAS